MTEELKLAQLFKNDGVAEVNVRGGGVDPELDAERAAELELIEKFLFREDFGSAYE